MTDRARQTWMHSVICVEKKRRISGLEALGKEEWKMK